MRVRVRGRKLGSRDHHCLSGRDAGYGFRDRISRDLSIFPCFSNFSLFLMTLASRGARSASRDSKLSKKRAERNSGRILRLFNCNDRGFLLLREALKAKFLPENFCVCALENCPKPS